MWKGKDKATDEDFDDINSPISYRHILSTSLGVRDPLRVVALCDSDAFYASCEMVRLGVNQDEPLVVLQWDSLIAVNYPARTFGISRMNKLKDALKKCPHLRVVHVATYKEGEKEPWYWDNVDTKTHKVSLDYYRRESTKIHALFKESLPSAEVERASIDEAFIDFTRPVRERILERFPHLSSVPSDAPHGLDTVVPPPVPIHWDDLGTLVPISPRSSPEDDPDGIAAIDGQEDVPATWHDVALSIAAEMMRKVRYDVHAKLGYTTSAGIARNKFLAKLSASYKKPNNQTILRNASIPNYLKPIAFQKIRFLGGKLGKAIHEEYDVSTVGDLLCIGLEEMQGKFGESAIWVYEVLRGIDRTEVKEKPAQNKSMLASKNLPQPITTATDGYHWIRVLAAELALRLNDARRADASVWPKTIALHARQGWEVARSRQAPFPFKPEVTVDLIAAAGNKLWRELVGVGGLGAGPIKVNSVQLAFTGLEFGEEGQRNIEGFLTTEKSGKRVREKEDSPEGVGSGDDNDDAQRSFVCSRCRKRVSLPHTTVSDQEALEKLKTEHDDFHFARDLVRIKPARASSDQTQDVLQDKKRRRAKGKAKEGEGEGIAKFFVKLGT